MVKGVGEGGEERGERKERGIRGGEVSRREKGRRGGGRWRGVRNGEG